MTFTYYRRARGQRRKSAVIVCMALLILCSPIMAGCLVRWLGGAFEGQPEQMHTLSPGARQLIKRAFADIGPDGVFDYHTHVVGIGRGGTGIEVNPNMRSWWHPLHLFKFNVYVSASGITDLRHADQQYVARLLRLIRAFPVRSRHLIIGFERYHDRTGKADRANSELYVPNEYVVKLRGKYPREFRAAVSIHPYRKDAVVELEKWARRGVHVVKWLPNAMGINPADPRTVPFYRMMKKYNMVLLTHAGEEKAVEAEEDQKLGNPLFLRVPLDLGLRVVVAHCASLGQNQDLDKPGKPLRDNFDLFLRLFQNPKYKGLLFGEISAMTQMNRLSRPLITLLRRKEFHGRLVNGSDYPLPAVNVVISTRSLMKAGLITQTERDQLNEIYNINPLLFDFVTKRTVHDPANPKVRLPARIFREHPGLK